MPKRGLSESAQAEQLLHTGLAARRVVPIDKSSRREQRHVLRQCELERESAAISLDAAGNFVVGEPEDRPVQRMDCESQRPPGRPTRERLPEHGHVRVVVPEQSPVEGLERSPDERRERACPCCAQSRRHTLPTLCPRATRSTAWPCGSNLLSARSWRSRPRTRAPAGPVSGGGAAGAG